MRKFIYALGLIPALLAAAEPGKEEAHLGPKDVLWRLKQGNAAYVSGQARPGQVTASRRNALVAGQHPHAVILTCADSRVPPEYIFNEGLGKLFVVRVAGVVADPVVVGSVEYAAEHLKVPLVVVMGHTKCGAVKAAIDTPVAPPPGGPGANIESILALLRPALAPHPPAHGGESWREAVYSGVETSVADLLKLSKIIPELGEHHEVGVVGAVYEIETGKVDFSDMVSMKPGKDGRIEWGPKQVARAH